MQVLYCGLDVGSSRCHLAAIDEDGDPVESRWFPTGECTLRSRFDSVEGPLQVHLEAGELAGWIRRVLLEKVEEVQKVIVSDPKAMGWIGKDSRKSDRIDAWKLAELLRIGRTHPVYYPDEESMSVFKKTVQHYEDLTQQQASLKQKIKARLRAEGIICKDSRVYSQEGRKAALKEIDSPARRAAVGQLYALLDHIRAAQQEAHRLMRAQGRRWPVIERLKEVPGIGPVLACRFVAYVQTPHRFADKRKLWRYCGLGVMSRSSNGRPLGYEKLDPSGNGRLKDLSRKAFEAARRCKEDNAFSRAYRRYVKSTGDPTHARLSVQRKIITVLWTLWKKGTHYDDTRG